VEKSRSEAGGDDDASYQPDAAGYVEKSRSEAGGDDDASYQPDAAGYVEKSRSEAGGDDDASYQPDAAGYVEKSRSEAGGDDDAVVSRPGLAGETGSAGDDWVRASQAERLKGIYGETWSTRLAAELTKRWGPGWSENPGEHKAAWLEDLIPQLATREEIIKPTRRPAGAPYTKPADAGGVTRKPEYEGEETKIGWRAGEGAAEVVRNSDRWVTKYEDPATIDQRRARSENKLVVDAAGAPIHGTWGWVIDQKTGALLLFKGEVIAIRDDERKTITTAEVMTHIGKGYNVVATHHTSPVAGMPVTGAGELTLEMGQIVSINDASGHYRPEAPQQYKAMRKLDEQGYDLEQAKIGLTGRTMGSRPTDKAGWIDAAASTNPNFPSNDVKLRYDQFEQTQGDEYQIRMKQALGTDLTEDAARRAQDTTGALASAIGRRDLSIVFAALHDEAFPQMALDELPDAAADALDQLAAADRTQFTAWFDAQEVNVQRALCSREQLYAIVWTESASDLIHEAGGGREVAAATPADRYNLITAIDRGDLTTVFSELAAAAYPQMLLDELAETSAAALDELAESGPTYFSQLFDAQKQNVQRALCSRDRLYAIAWAASTSDLIREAGGGRQPAVEVESDQLDGLLAAISQGDLAAVFTALADDPYPQMALDDLPDAFAASIDDLAEADPVQFTGLFNAQESKIQRALCSRERLDVIISGKVPKES
jgi:hypothetical protein